MALPSKGEDTRGYTLCQAGLCPPFKSPLILGKGRTQPGVNIKGEMGFCAIIAKKRVNGPESVHSKNCISCSQGRWALAFCMEATKSLKALSEH